MKRLFLVALLAAVALPLCLGQIERTAVTPVMLASPQSRWVELGSITESQSTPGVTARGYAALLALTDAKTFIWNVPNWVRKVEMSFQTTTDADLTTIELWAFADNKQVDTSGGNTIADDAVYLGQLALTGGTQTGSHGNVYVDTIVATDGIANFWVLDSAVNHRCVVRFQSGGYKIIYGIATTLQGSSTLYAYGRYFQ
jgi:hypothetical protein